MCAKCACFTSIIFHDATPMTPFFRRVKSNYSPFGPFWNWDRIDTKQDQLFVAAKEGKSLDDFGLELTAMPCLKPEGMHKARIMKKKIAKMELFIINQNILWRLCTFALLLYLLTIAHFVTIIDRLQFLNKSGFRSHQDSRNKTNDFRDFQFFNGK